MHGVSLDPYVERVYGYAMRRVFSREEAEELTQDILLTVLQELPRLRDRSRFEPFLWGIARRVTLRFSRTMGSRRRQVSLDDVSAIPMLTDDAPAEYAALRRRVAMLSAQWRDMLVLYYFDGLSTREIARRLSLPEGTVTWRLSNARKRLKEEYETMNETALRPQTLWIGYSGSDANTNPCEYINDALSQNLLILCREAAQTVETLAAHTGVPAYYVEDRLQELVRREVMSEPAKGRYRTDILIYTSDIADYTQRQRALFTPLAADFAAALRQTVQKAAALGFRTAGRAENDLLWLLGVMAMEHLQHQWNPHKTVPHPLRWDGGRWSYHGYVAAPSIQHTYRLRRLTSLNLGSTGTYAHYSYQLGAFASREMMYSHQINICEDILNGREVPPLALSAALELGGDCIRREPDGRFSVDVPSFTLAQHQAFCRIAEEAFAPVMPRYQEALRRYAAGYRQRFPAHMADAVQRDCAYAFLSAFADPVRSAIVDKGLLPAPTPGAYCDVMVQFK